MVADDNTGYAGLTKEFVVHVKVGEKEKERMWYIGWCKQRMNSFQKTSNVYPLDGAEDCNNFTISSSTVSLVCCIFVLNEIKLLQLKMTSSDIIDCLAIVGLNHGLLNKSQAKNKYAIHSLRAILVWKHLENTSLGKGIILEVKRWKMGNLKPNIICRWFCLLLSRVYSRTVP